MGVEDEQVPEETADPDADHDKTAADPKETREGRQRRLQLKRQLRRGQKNKRQQKVPQVLAFAHVLVLRTRKQSQLRQHPGLLRANDPRTGDGGQGFQNQKVPQLEQHGQNAGQKSYRKKTAGEEEICF